MGKDKAKRYIKKEQKKDADDRPNAGAAVAAVVNGKGCICPIGCLVGKEILVNDVIGVRAANAAENNKYVKVYCTNGESGKCNLVPFMHDVCFKKWEDILVRQLRMRNTTRDWNDDKVKRHLWLADGGTFCHRSRKCSCGGFITRVDPEDEELPKPTEKAQQKAIKAANDPDGLNKKKLPLLVTAGSKLGGASIYKTCPGYGARGIAAPYSSNDYVDRANRVRNRQEREAQEEREQRPSQQQHRQMGRHPEWKSLVRAVASPAPSKPGESDEEEHELGFRRMMSAAGASRSRTNSFSSLMDESSNFWARPASPFAVYNQPPCRPSSGSGTSGGGSARNGRKSTELPMDFEDDMDEFITDEELISEIRDLLNSLGGQLDLDDPLLTSIVGGRASVDLIVAISDAGGLGPWLSIRPGFDVGNGRVRLCRNVKRSPAQLNTTGTVQTKTDNRGAIYCNAYDCTVYFDEDTDGFEELCEGDIVKVEAVERRQSIEGLRWKAITVSLLQQGSQSAIMTGLRRSCETEEPKRPVPNLVTKENLKEKLKAKLAETAQWADAAQDYMAVARQQSPGIESQNDFWPFWSKNDAKAKENGSMNGGGGNGVKDDPIHQVEISGDDARSSMLNTEAKEDGAAGSSMVLDEDDSMRELTAEYLPTTGDYGGASAYGDVLAMVKSWDIQSGDNE